MRPQQIPPELQGSDCVVAAGASEFVQFHGLSTGDFESFPHKHSGLVRCVDSLSDREFATGGSDGIVKVWSLESVTFQPAHVLDNHAGGVFSISHIASSSRAENPVVVVGDGTGQVHIWSVAASASTQTRRLSRPISLGSRHPVRSCKILSRTQAAVCAGTAIHLVDLTRGAVVKSLTQLHTAPVQCLTLGPGNEFLISGDELGVICIVTMRDFGKWVIVERDKSILSVQSCGNGYFASSNSKFEIHMYNFAKLPNPVWQREWYLSPGMPAGPVWQLANCGSDENSKTICAIAGDSSTMVSRTSTDMSDIRASLTNSARQKRGGWKPSRVSVMTVNQGKVLKEFEMVPRDGRCVMSIAVLPDCPVKASIVKQCTTATSRFSDRLKRIMSDYTKVKETYTQCKAELERLEGQLATRTKYKQRSVVDAARIARTMVENYTRKFGEVVSGDGKRTYLYEGSIGPDGRMQDGFGKVYLLKERGGFKFRHNLRPVLTYEGMFKDGRKHGDGIEYNQKGQPTNVRFVDGSRVKRADEAAARRRSSARVARTVREIPASQVSQSLRVPRAQLDALRDRISGSVSEDDDQAIAKSLRVPRRPGGGAPAAPSARFVPARPPLAPVSPKPPRPASLRTRIQRELVTPASPTTDLVSPFAGSGSSVEIPVAGEGIGSDFARLLVGFNEARESFSDAQELGMNASILHRAVAGLKPLLKMAEEVLTDFLAKTRFSNSADGFALKPFAEQDPQTFQVVHVGEFSETGSGHGQSFVKRGAAGGGTRLALVYDGDFDRGLREGTGREFYEHDVVERGEEETEGEASAGIKHRGVMQYEGGFRQGKRHGRGTEYNKKGVRTFSGQFLAGVRHGVGVVYEEDGQTGKPTAIFRKGRFVRYHLSTVHLPIIDLQEVFRSSNVSYSDLIGRGAFGEVFKVTFQGKVWAGKSMRFDQMDRREKQRVIEDTERTLRLTASLDHPNIIKCGGWCPEGKRIGYLTELCTSSVDGLLLKAVARRESGSVPSSEYVIPLDEKIRILFEVSLGMQYLHQNIVMHRDLKWDNVMMTSTGQVKLIDFDFARVDDSAILEEAEITKRLGTMGFMSPEVHLKLPHSMSCDVYSFGVMIYCLIFERTMPYEFDKAADCFNIKCPCGEDGISRFQLMDHVSKCGLRPKLLRKRGRGTWNDKEKTLLALMVKCWTREESARPKFSGIVRVFENVLMQKE